MTAERGRPSLLTESKAANAREMRANGKTIEQIASALDVSTRTVDRILAPPNVLPRTGQPPIQLGEKDKKVASTSGKHYGQKAGHTASDYWDITIYALAPRPDAPKYCVAISYYKELRDVKSEHHTAILCDEPATVLATYDPLAVLIGYPDPEQFAKLQKQLELNCSRQYQTLVSDVLTKFPEDVTEAHVTYREGVLLDIFSHLCHQVRASWTFTKNEASLIVDACHDTHLFGDSFLNLPGEIRTAIDANELDTKWNVDAAALCETLRGMTSADLAALAVSIRTFWEHTDKTRGQALTLAGFIFE
jgi:hypothetical protein